MLRLILTTKEELKQQLGDVLPIAMRALEKSTGKTAKELFKMMEMGQLGAEYIKPFIDSIGDLVNKGNAVSKAMETARTQEKRFINESKQAANTIFKAGFEEGLVDLYKTLTDQIQKSQPQLEKLGKFFELVFKGIARIVEYLTPVVRYLVDNIETIAALFLAGKAWALLGSKVLAVVAAVRSLNSVTALLIGGQMLNGLKILGLALARAFLPITSAYMTMQELIALFDDNLVGLFEKNLGYQVNLKDFTKTKLEKDSKGNMMSGEKVGLFTGDFATKRVSREEFAKMGVLDKTEHLQGLTSYRSLFGSGLSNKASASNVTQNITVQAPSEDVALGIVDRLQKEALMR